MALQLQSRDYTVGWICANPHELVAAMRMLDEEHNSLQRDLRTGDRNIYALGRISEHNVVIACLPPGHHGAVSAAVVATNMVATFPAMRFGLLVGIGGGIPSKSRDIRLGDVVVSMPDGRFGGVVQFDRGKLSAGSFQRTGSLNSPPSVLMISVARLLAEHEYREPRLVRYLQFAIEQTPTLKENYNFPGRQDDRLFQSDYFHATDNPECTSCDPSQIIPREERSSDEPLVHYGLIASGNKLIKDAKERDHLMKELDAICIEMEAAGLMNDFPCLVIRGIADYADSHKNKRWQGYAAMTAAAYAKELLDVTPGNSVHNNATVADVLDLNFNTIGTSDSTLDLSDTASQASTLVGTLEPRLVDATVNELARALASDRKLKPLYSTALFRMSRSVYQRHLITALVSLSKSVQKLAGNPLERATAWMLRHYKSPVALRIYEMVKPKGHAVDTLGSSLHEIPFAQQQQLMRFINERFAVTGQEASGAQISPAEAGGNELRQDEDQEREENEPPHDEDQEEYDGEDPPGPEVLADLSQVEQILCSGAAYEEMYKQLKTALFPSPSQLIKKVLQRHISHDDQRQSITCVVEWQLLEYLKYENIRIDDFDSIFTITGEFDRSCAVRLEDYMSEVWSTGKKLLGFLKTSVDGFLTENATSSKGKSIAIDGSHIEMQLFQRSENSNERALVKISGSFDQISESLEQFAWLAATLRPHIEGQLTVSDINFSVQQAKVEDSSESLYDELIFHLSLFSQDVVPQADSDEAGQCWTSLFTESILAYGFPIPENGRPEGVLGLEIPFEIMAAFAGVKFPIWLEDRIAFAGSTSMLIPVICFGDSIQWHFQKSDNRFKKAVRRTKVLDSQLETLDLSKLVTSRAFLGYCKTSEVLLGTADFEDVEILESDVPRTGPYLAIQFEGPLVVGVSAKGYATSTAGTTWRFNRGETALVQAQTLSQDERFKRAAKNSALLYDQEACVAFLVSELSVILQMVSVYLRETSKLKKSKIPLAKISADGGQAAYEAIGKANDLMVPFGTGPPQKYVDIVDSFLTITEQRKTQTSVRRLWAEIHLKDGLRGWDYVDVQAKSYEIWELKLKTERPIWWKLFKGSETLVLFSRMTKFPIRVSNNGNGPFKCSAWEEIPRGKHLLLANMTQLQRLKRKLCQNTRKYPTRYMLTNNLAWARPTHSRLFEQSCREGNSCNPLQTICKVDFKREKLRDLKKVLWKEDAYLQDPGDMEPSGAVLFVDDPSAFENRPCWRPQSQAPANFDWNRFFILVTIVCFLAYSMFIEASLLPQKTMHRVEETRRFLDSPVM